MSDLEDPMPFGCWIIIGIMFGITLTVTMIVVFHL
jgi:hypothetical protein